MAASTGTPTALHGGWQPEPSTGVSPFEKVYAGALVNGRRQVTVAGDLGVLPLRCLNFYTPGFAWGFHGAAPDELAIAILHDYFGLRRPVFDRRVLSLYQAFADEIVSKLANDRSWSLTAGLVGKWVGQREGLAVVA